MNKTVLASMRTSEKTTAPPAPPQTPTSPTGEMERELTDATAAELSLARREKAKQAWSLLRKNFRELVKERKMRSTKNQWAYLRTGLRIKADAAKTRRDLYERYGWKGLQHSHQYPSTNPMAVTYKGYAYNF